jgi:hypothetical protein
MLAAQGAAAADGAVAAEGAAATETAQDGVHLVQAAAAAAPAAMEAAHRGPVTKRWIEQRWVLDNVIQANGIDWDQPRSIYRNVPCGVEASADFAAIRLRVKKYADCSPAFEATARRREARAGGRRGGRARHRAGEFFHGGNPLGRCAMADRSEQ